MELRYNKEFLHNFQIEYLYKIIDKLWKEQKSKEDFQLSTLLKKRGGDNNWEKISSILNELKDNGKLNDTSLQETLYNEIVHTLPDDIYIYPFKLDENISAEVIYRSFSQHQRFNLSILHPVAEKSNLTIQTIRKENDKLIILFRLGYGLDKENQKTIFFIPCIIDFNNKMFIIKVKYSVRKKTIYKPLEVVNIILNYMKDWQDNLLISTLLTSEIQSIFFEMFKKESSRAEKIIKEHDSLEPPEDLNNDIIEFLANSLNINQPTNYQDYEDMEEFEDEKADFITNLNKIKSIYYHDKAKKMSSLSFGNRYMFAFTFFDGISSKSATRNSDKQHVYTGNLYWTLKDLIFTEEKISELSMYYKFDPNDFTINVVGEKFYFVEVNFKEYNGGFLIEFLNRKKRDERREKKYEFIINEFSNYFSRLSLFQDEPN